MCKHGQITHCDCIFLSFLVLAVVRMTKASHARNGEGSDLILVSCRADVSVHLLYENIIRPRQRILLMHGQRMTPIWTGIPLLQTRQVAEQLADTRKKNSAKMKKVENLNCLKM